MEVDPNPLAQGGWVHSLHDPTLDRETTGAGPRQRHPRVGPRPPCGCGTARAGRRHILSPLWAHSRETLPPILCRRAAHLQLDLKVGADSPHAGPCPRLRPRCRPRLLVTSFFREATPLPSGASLMRRVSGWASIPATAVRCLDLAASRAFDAFVSEAVAAVPDARIIYLHRALVRQADQWGCRPASPCFATGNATWTSTLFESAPRPASGRSNVCCTSRPTSVTTDDPTAIAGHVRSGS